MALSSELHELLARRGRPRPRELRLEARPEESRDISDGEDSDDDPVILPPCLALPPIPPAWSQLLCGRAHEAASAQYGRMALLAVGCRLGVTPSQSALSEAARCRSVGAVRRLLILAYGSRGLSVAFELAGILQPSTSAEFLPYSKASQSVETAEQSVTRQGFTSQARVMRWFDRQEPVPPPWRSSPPPAGADDGSWVGC
jgi:hypothetical protein